MIDLHTHSHYSDGCDSPAQLVRQAQEAGLAAIALCDHNTLAGLPEFLEAGKKSPVKTVPGIELTTEHEGKELHILALFLKQEHYGPIRELLGEYRRQKERSNRALVEALRQAGMELDYDRLARDKKDYVNRAHIGQALLEKGYVESVKEAFRKYLSPDSGFYVPPRRPDACRTIHLVRQLGAVPVLAHPLLSVSEDRLRAFLPEAVKNGLAAMEVYYTEYTPKQTALARGIAAEFGLLPSGGSDYHGTVKPEICLGVGRGTLVVPDSILPPLEELAE